MSTSSEKLLWLPSPNGRLSAVLHQAESDRIVILAHGFTGTKCETGRLLVSTARAFAASGFNVVRFDFFGSGDSEGEFNEMTPNTEIADLLAVISWARKRYKSVGVLGLSFGGAVSICATAQSGKVDALVTWSSVPSFKFWRPKPEKGEDFRNPNTPGKRFYIDRPSEDVPEAYKRLTLPKLQIQGDKDIPGFLEEFSKYFPEATSPKKHIVIKGADHTFNLAKDRGKAITQSIRWMEKYLP